LTLIIIIVNILESYIFLNVQNLMRVKLPGRFHRGQVPEEGFFDSRDFSGNLQ